MRPGGGQVLVVRPPGGGHESHACPHPSAWPHSNVCMRVGLSTTLETLLLRNPLPGVAVWVVLHVGRDPRALINF